jgi:hypothetical protein
MIGTDVPHTGGRIGTSNLPGAQNEKPPAHTPSSRSSARPLELESQRSPITPKPILNATLRVGDITF